MLELFTLLANWLTYDLMGLSPETKLGISIMLKPLSANVYSLADIILLEVPEQQMMYGGVMLLA